MKPAWKERTELEAKKPTPLFRHKKRYCIAKDCRKITGNKGMNRYYCDGHHRALSGGMEDL